MNHDLIEFNAAVEAAMTALRHAAEGENPRMALTNAKALIDRAETFLSTEGRQAG